MRDLEKRYGADAHELMSPLEEQVENRDVMRVVSEVNDLLDDLEDDMGDIGCRT